MERALASQAVELRSSRDRVESKDKEIGDLRHQLDDERKKRQVLEEAQWSTRNPNAAATTAASTNNGTSTDVVPGVYRKNFPILPPSSAWCYGTALRNR